MHCGLCIAGLEHVPQLTDVSSVSAKQCRPRPILNPPQIALNRSNIHKKLINFVSQVRLIMDQMIKNGQTGKLKFSVDNSVAPKFSKENKSTRHVGHGSGGPVEKYAVRFSL